MSFISSGWLALYILIPIIMIGAILVHTKRNKAWKSIVAPRLQKHLVREGSQVKTWFSIASALLGAALLITALARPYKGCLLYTSPSPRDQRGSRMPSSA